MLEILYKPQHNINYDFIVYVYFASVVIGIILLGLEKLSYSTFEIAKGLWIVFAPFFVCLPWALYMRSASKSIVSADDKEKKKK